MQIPCLRLKLVVFVKVSLIFLLYSNTSTAVDLKSVYAESYELSPSIQAAQAQLDAKEAQLSQSTARLLPELMLEASYGDSRSDISSNNHGHSVGLKLSQSLLDGSLWASRSVSAIEYDIAKITLRAATQAHLTKVVANYFSILVAQETLLAAESQLSALIQNAERAKIAFRIGSASITDKLEAEARLDLAKAELLAAQNDLANSQYRLEVMLETRPQFPLPAPEKISMEISADDFSITRALENNAELLIAQRKQAVANKEKTKAIASRLPTLNLVGRTTQQSQTYAFPDSSIESRTNTLTLDFSVPLFSSGYHSAKVAQANAQRLEAIADQEHIKQKIKLEHQAALLNVKTGAQRVGALGAALKSSESALEATQKGLEVGIRDNIDLLDAQKQVFSVKKDYAKARYDYHLSVIKLKEITGVLNEQDLFDLSMAMYKK